MIGGGDIMGKQKEDLSSAKVIGTELVLNESSDHEGDEFTYNNKFSNNNNNNPVAPVTSLYGTPQN